MFVTEAVFELLEVLFKLYDEPPLSVWALSL